ncbi:AEC family transporter [Nodosilinea sp. E11]|uniref:AEC family transporter n=1 Tax=Nodosilinea sp. E11 TaxID=3037479 RepID=UPI0029344D1B|nr:AEC family transporter [Nodosilinea sp. E11]
MGVGIALGALLYRFAPHRGEPQGLYYQVPLRLGRFLFWVGIPLSIIGFMRRADLSGNLYLAPVVAWGAILLGLGCSRLWLSVHQVSWSRPTQGSFSLAAMLGNTGYIGYPVVLLLPQLGVSVFGWALFYDALGTLLGSYGLGAILAAEMGGRPQSPLDLTGARPGMRQWLSRLRAVGQNPIILAFGLGLWLKTIALPAWLDSALYQLAWVIVVLSLVLMGLRMQQLRSWQHVHRATAAVAIKMLVLPLAVGLALTALGVDGPARLVMILQAGMPCAFSNLVLAEAYDLDRDLSVACVGLSSASLLFTLPLWLWAFSGE